MCQHTVLCYNEHRKDFVNFCKFTMKRQMRLEIIGLSAFWVTEILTANRLLSNTAEETDFLNGTFFAVHRRVDI